MFLDKIDINNPIIRYFDWPDTRSYRNDASLSLNGSCADVLLATTQDDPVVVDENCTVSVSHMCNGVKSCYNCSDEAEDVCEDLLCESDLSMFMLQLPVHVAQ